MNKYFVKTFGCQMNHSDSERIAAVLESNGLKATSNINEADLVVFNTCGVRQMAEDRVYGQVRNVKIQNPKSKIILTGCLANRKDVQRRLRGKIDLFCEIKEFPKKIKKLVIPSPPRRIEGSNVKKLDFSTPPALAGFAQNDRDYLNIIPKYKNGFQACVPIMTGCNNFCAYCVVPYARGREVSRPAEEVVKEVEKLVKKGYKEIVLLGQNVNSYKFEIPIKRGPTLAGLRSDLNRTINFSQLLKKINAIPGHFWINFISNHPKDVTDEMIEAVAKLPKVCECFHLPLQSGNDEIIQKMNRKYTGQQYLNLIKKIKSAYKKYKSDKLFSITSDIIVGFPGETKKQFLGSAEVMKKAKYDMVYFGQYSPRPGTVAWKLKDSVSKKEKVRREKYLNEILKKTAFDNNQKYVGKNLEVLIEKQEIPKAELWEKKSSSLGKIVCYGKTRTMKNVKITATKKGLVGKFAKIKITKANTWNLEGALIK